MRASHVMHHAVRYDDAGTTLLHTRQAMLHCAMPQSVLIIAVTCSTTITPSIAPACCLLLQHLIVQRLQLGCERAARAPADGAPINLHHRQDSSKRACRERLVRTVHLGYCWRGEQGGGACGVEVCGSCLQTRKWS
jgi:hypothetical protein